MFWRIFPHGNIQLLIVSSMALPWSLSGSSSGSGMSLSGCGIPALSPGLSPPGTAWTQSHCYTSSSKIRTAWSQLPFGPFPSPCHFLILTLDCLDPLWLGLTHYYSHSSWVQSLSLSFNLLFFLVSPLCVGTEPFQVRDTFPGWCPWTVFLGPSLFTLILALNLLTIIGLPMAGLFLF